MIALLFWLGVIGAVLDWRYIRQGGAKPSRADYIYLAIAAAIVIIGVVVLGLLGGRAEGLGDMAALLTSLLVFLWGWRRFRVRRSHPAR